MGWTNGPGPWEVQDLGPGQDRFIESRMVQGWFKVDHHGDVVDPPPSDKTQGKTPVSGCGCGCKSFTFLLSCFVACRRCHKMTAADVVDQEFTYLLGEQAQHSWTDGL